MRIFYLGDTHGNFALIHQYITMFGIKDAHIIQVGDFGVGFNTFNKDKHNLALYHQKLVNNNIFLWAIRGNHDYRPYFNNDPFGFTNIKLVKDYTVLKLEGKNILCIGGATSVDRTMMYTKYQMVGDYDTKTGNECWWPDECFTIDRDRLAEFRNINIVATHTCPDYCPPDNKLGFGPFVETIIKQTGDFALKADLTQERKDVTDAFQILKMNNDIQFHYYGHFHRSDDITMYGTKHRVLNIGELWEERE